MASPLVQIAFYYLAAASVASAILAVTRRNPVHSILWVLALFLHVAGVFLIVGAEFLAVVQVIVYAGAILVFYLFFLMLLDLPSEVKGLRFNEYWRWAVAIGVVFVALAWYAASLELMPVMKSEVTSQATAGNLSVVGTALFTEFTLPFEIVSLVLLAAIVGAVAVARKKTES